jgi:hypothetical protein
MAETGRYVTDTPASAYASAASAYIVATLMEGEIYVCQNKLQKLHSPA